MLRVIRDIRVICVRFTADVTDYTDDADVGTARASWCSVRDTPARLFLASVSPYLNAV